MKRRFFLKISIDKNKVVFYWAALSIFYMVVLFLATAQNANSYPIYAFLTTGGRFDDFYNSVTFDQSFPFKTAGQFVLMPLAFFVYRALSPNGYFTLHDGLFIFQTISIGLMFFGISKLVGSTRSTVLLMVSYPVIFGFFRANNETLLISIFIIGLWKLELDSESAFGKASLAVGQMIEPTLFPLFIFPIKKLLLSKVFVVSIVVCSVTFLGFLAIQFRVTPLIYFEEIRRYLNADLGSEVPIILHNHSLIAGLMAWGGVLTGTYPSIDLWHRSVTLGLFVPIAGIWTLFFLRRGRYVRDGIDRTILATVLTVILPTHSFSYRIMWLLIPLCLILREKGVLIIRGRRLIQLFLIFIIMQPKTFFYTKSQDLGLGFYEASLIDPLLLIGLFFVTARSSRSKLQERVYEHPIKN